MMKTTISRPAGRRSRRPARSAGGIAAETILAALLSACAHSGSSPSGSLAAADPGRSLDEVCRIAAEIRDPGNPWPLPSGGWYLEAPQMAEMMQGEAPPPTDRPDLDELEQDPGLAQDPVRCGRALREQDYTDLDAFFGVDADGRPLLTPDEIARVRPLMARIRIEQDRVTWPYKDTDPTHYPEVKAFRRSRPFIAYSGPPDNLRVCPGTRGVTDPVHISPEDKARLEAHLGSSFPSAHAAAAEAQARALGLIFPARKDRFLARAHQIGRDRAVLRVHYPSDVAAGFVIGDRIFASLWASPRFVRDVEATRSCGRQFLPDPH